MDIFTTTQSRKIATSAKSSSISDSCEYSPPEKRLQQLWKQVELKHQRARECERAYENARAFMKSELARTRVDYCKALADQTHKLIKHLGQKSLLTWQVDALCEWIVVNLQILDTQGAHEVRRLTEQYREVCHARLSLIETQLLNDELNMTMEEFVVAVEGSQAGSIHSACFRHIFEQSSSKDDMRSFTSVKSTRPESYRKSACQSEALHGEGLKKKLVERLFRRTARVLHPDHEYDPAIRERKQKWMQSLLAARKDGNIAVIFEYYRRYVDTSCAQFNQAELASLVDILQRQIQRLDREYREYINQSSTHQWVHHHLMGKGAQEQDKLLFNLKKKFVDDLAEVVRVAPHVVSLAALKKFLANRGPVGDGHA